MLGELWFAQALEVPTRANVHRGKRRVLRRPRRRLGIPAWVLRRERGVVPPGPLSPVEHHVLRDPEEVPVLQVHELRLSPECGSGSSKGAVLETESSSGEGSINITRRKWRLMELFLLESDNYDDLLNLAQTVLSRHL